MPLIQWNEKLELNIYTIDNQHKRLVQIINEFHEEIENKSTKDLIANVISKMKAYTQIHFKTEEDLFIKNKLPDMEAHINKHQKFISKVSNLEERYINGNIILSSEITNFLKDWLINHIQGDDRAYITKLNNLTD